MTQHDSIEPERLLKTFVELLRIDSPSGEEREIAAHVQRRLKALGLSTHADEAGNLIAFVEGAGEPLLLCAHMDHVEPCRGITPVVEKGVVRSDGTTVLGADDTSGVAIILELLEIAMKRPPAQRPALDIVFTVREEVGLEGAKALDMSRLRARHGVVLDMGGPRGWITVQGPSHDRISAVIHGRASHAACAPEQGVNAIIVAAEAIAAMKLGRVDESTTANIGIIHGGNATNVVPDRVEIQGEARSLDADRLRRQTQSMLDCLQRSAERHGAMVETTVEREYEAFRVPESAPVVQRLARALRALGVEPNFVTTAGGSDSNIFNARGIQTVNISTGMENVHSTQEYIALEEMVFCARVLSRALELG